MCTIGPFHTRQRRRFLSSYTYVGFICIFFIIPSSLGFMPKKPFEGRQRCCLTKRTDTRITGNRLLTLRREGRCQSTYDRGTAAIGLVVFHFHCHCCFHSHRHCRSHDYSWKYRSISICTLEFLLRMSAARSGSISAPQRSNTGSMKSSWAAHIVPINLSISASPHSTTEQNQGMARSIFGFVYTFPTRSLASCSFYRVQEPQIEVALQYEIRIYYKKQTASWLL